MPKRKPKAVDSSKQSGFVYNPNFGGNPFAPKPLIEKIGNKPMPLLPAPKPSGQARIGLRPGVEQQLENQRMKQDKIKKQDLTLEQTTSRRPTSSTSTTSTTTSPSTTPSPTSSTTKPETTMPKKQQSTNRETKGQGFKQQTFENERLDKNRAVAPPLYTDFNQKDDGKGYFNPESSGARVVLRMPVRDTVYLDPNQVTDVSGSDILNMLLINAASISAAFTASSSSNSTIYDAHVQVFNQISLDALNSSRSGLIDSFTLANFRSAMGAVAQALEYYYCLDSIVSQNSINMSADDINRTADNYRAYFSTSDVFELRTKLQNCLKGCAFPPNYSQFIRWFYQTYKVTDLSQAPQYRYVPGEEFLIVGNARKGGTAALKTKIDALCAALPTYNKIFALLANVYPVWSINKLPASCSMAVFDEQHHEIFVNEPLIFVDPNVTYSGSSYSVYPVAYTLTNGNNDIPYYQNKNPKNGDTGFPFACQTIVKINNTTGNVALQTTWTGLKCFVALQGTQSKGSNFCNKFFFITDSGSGECFPRANNYRYIIGTGDAHSSLSTTVGGTATTILASKANSNFQRVYFNNFNAPRVYTNVLMFNLFSLRPNAMG